MDNMTFKQTYQLMVALLNCNAIPQDFKYSDVVNIIKALERQIPIKPNFKSYDVWNGEYYCPICNKFLGFYHNKHEAHCPDCGQEIDWNRKVNENDI